MLTVCSGFSPSGYREYGAKFLLTFDKFWPHEVGLVVYVEQPVGNLGRAKQRMLSDIPGVMEFIERHKNVPERNGLNGLRKPYWFKTDAVKFCRQCFIPEAAAQGLPDGSILAWFDADVVTFMRVPQGFVEELLGDTDICYLGRKPKHSELGFWAVRLNSRTRTFLKDFADIFRTDEVFTLKEWHSAYVFDWVRGRHELVEHDLTPGGHGHVWFQSALGGYTDHLKGPRKKVGRSAERRS